jgi:uncharacterized protein
MRRLALALLFVICGAAQAAAPSFPPLTGRVVDQANIIPDATERELSAKLEAHERATGHQLVVATIASLDGRDIAEYGVELGRAWGIGQKEKDTGAILLVAPNDREVRIEVGYGLEGILTDARSRGIIENSILPSFRAGQMDAGVVAGVEAILGALRGDPDAAPTAIPDAARGEGDPREYIGLLIAFLIIAWLRRGRRRRGIWPLVLGGASVWHSGSRRSGGGGFRGGGGSFGGGGASGKW